MKTKLILLLFAVFTHSLNHCLAVEEPSLLELRKTDLEKMGLKGKVKILKADFDSINFNRDGYITYRNGVNYVYDKKGNLIKTQYENKQKKIVDKSIFVYDKNGKFIEEYSVNENGERISNKRYTYNKRGDLTNYYQNDMLERNYEYDKKGNLLVCKNYRYNIIQDSTGYDLKGNIKEKRTYIYYMGNTDRLHHIRLQKFKYDTSNRMVEECKEDIYLDGSTTDEAPICEQIEYNEKGKWTVMKKKYGIDSMIYDKEGKELALLSYYSSETPDNRTNYIYDSIGKIERIEESDNSGKITSKETYSYHPNGQLKEKKNESIYSPWTDLEAYDEQGNLIERHYNETDSSHHTYYKKVYYVNDNHGNWIEKSVSSGDSPKALRSYGKTRRTIEYYE